MPEYDSYDLIVAGGGTAGCLIASRIAQHGINPSTGDRLRVALIEGGPSLSAVRQNYVLVMVFPNVEKR